MKHAKLCQPGVEPGSIAWKATMLAATPLTLVVRKMSCSLNIWCLIMFGVLMMKHSNLRQPGVGPGSIAWKPVMLGATPLTLVIQ